MYGRIYFIENKLNGKRYIGQTVQPLNKRISRHKWSCTLKGCRMAITQAIAKYGWENFEFGIICECKDQEELDKMEMEIIKQQGTLWPRGYNIEHGGNGLGKRGPEFGLKMSKILKGRKVSPETRKRLSESHKGYKPSAETRKKMSVANKGKGPTEAARRKGLDGSSQISALIDDNGGVFLIRNMAQFAKEKGHSKSKLCELVRGKRDRYKQYRLHPLHESIRASKTQKEALNILGSDAHVHWFSHQEALRLDQKGNHSPRNTKSSG